MFSETLENWFNQNELTYIWSDFIDMYKNATIIDCNDGYGRIFFNNNDLLILFRLSFPENCY
jgi:hypothetical protein